MSVYLILFLEFFKIGLFSVGGGLATLPFLNQLIPKYNWYTSADLANMLAISESTPGPIGINMSTYVGFLTAGIRGSIIATLALVLPAYLIIICIARFINKFKDNQYLDSVFHCIKPAVTGLIFLALLDIYKISIFNGNVLGFLNLKSFILFAVLTFLIFRFKKHPVIYILLGGIIGTVFKL